MDLALRLSVLGLVVSLALLPTQEAPAQAQELDKATRVEVKEAMRLYKEGRYQEAAAMYARLSVKHEDVLVFVRNLGACWYYLRKPEPAISNLRDYLHRKKGLAADDRAEVERWIAEMERLREYASGMPAATAPATAAPASPANQGVPLVPPPAPPAAPWTAPAAGPYGNAPAPVGTTPMPPAPVAPAVPAPAAYASQQPPVASSSPQPAGPSRAMRVAAISCGVVGLASIGTGIYFYTRARSYSDKVSNTPNPKSSDWDAGKNAETLQWVFYSVGGAALVTGGLLYLFDRPSPSPQTGVAFTGVGPAVGPTMVGLSTFGAF